MRRYEGYKRLLKKISSGIIIGIEVIIYALFWYGFFDKIIGAPFWRKGNWLIIALYGLLTLFFSKIYGALKVGYSKIWDIILSQFLSLFCVNIITYLQLALLERRFAHEEQFILMTLIEMGAIIVWSVSFHWLYKKMFPPRRMLLIYGERSSFHLLEKMNTRKDKYNVCEAVNINQGYDKVFHLIQKYEAVIIGDIPSVERNTILKYCFKESIRTYTLPKISDIFLKGAEEIDLFDSPLLLCRNYGLTPDQRFVKRILDILVSGIAVILTSPVMLLIAAAIKLYDGGPVLYKQKRYTMDKDIFEVYKFRSMVVDAEKDGIVRLAEQHDDRVTPIGRFLRRSRLDELPQFFNILKGEMSLVGPRPERPEIAEMYEELIPEFSFRLKVKGGLTGYAQIYGKYNTEPYDKLKLDLKYITEYSFWLDIKLIIKTVKVLFIKESTEGVTEGQVTAIFDDDFGKLKDLIDENRENGKV